MPTEERMPVNDKGLGHPSADNTAAWWPPALGHHTPDDLLLVAVTSSEQWTAETWPRIGPDGRLARGAPVTDLVLDPCSLEPVPMSGLGVALSRLTDGPDSQGRADVSILAVHRPSTSTNGEPTPADRVAEISPDVWDAALAAVWRPYAWTYWPVWRGDPELIAHVGRTMEWALHDVLEASVHVQTKIAVGPGDEERFDGPNAVITDLTAYGARHMRTVTIDTDTKGIEIAVHIHTGQDADQPVRSKAVLLEVTASAPGQLAEVRAIHARLRAAVERGHPRRMIVGESIVGHAAVDASGDLVPALSRGPADAAACRNDGWFALGVVALITAFFVLPIVAEIVSGVTLLITALAITAPLGAIVAVSVFGDGIMLGTSNRVLRLKTSVIALIGGAFTTSVSTGIKRIFDLF